MAPSMQAGAGRALRAQPQGACFVCGSENPSGLRIHYEVGADGAITARWSPGAQWEGFQGIVHGGVVSTVLDEAMSKAVMAAGCEALTAELRVRFRHHVAPGTEYRIRGWVVERSRRLIRTEATLATAHGEVFAHAWASFLALGPRPTKER